MTLFRYLNFSIVLYVVDPYKKSLNFKFRDFKNYIFLSYTFPKVYNCSIVGEGLPPSGSRVIPKASA
jgi:hypothetical protein